MTHEQTTQGGLSARAMSLIDLARLSCGEMTDAQRTNGLRALRGRMGQKRSARTWWTVAFAAAGVAATASFVLPAPPHRRDLTVQVEGGSLEAGGAVEAVSTPPILHFSDGSEIALRAGAHVRVRALDEHGARIGLEDGEAHVRVMHARETRWAFEAGPFVVSVTGTAFGMSWQGSAAQLDVRLESGAVTVTGPPPMGQVAVHAGQWLTVRGQDVRIRALDSREAGALSQEDASDRAPAANSPSPEGPLQPKAPPPDVEPRTRPAAAVRPPSVESEGSGAERWSSELADGRFDLVVAQALELGLDVAFARRPNGELTALADAARYSGRGDIARGALKAQRRRFPSSESARTAAFSLGRLAEAEGDPRSALGWFDTYLAEAKSGTYAADALGRKMEIVQKLDGKAEASRLAEEYLRRFPSGPYADAAHALLADAP